MKLPELHRLIQVLTPEEKAALDDHFRNNGYSITSLYRQFFEYLLTDSGEFNEADFTAFAGKLGLKDGTLRNYCKRVYEELRFVLLHLRSREDLVLAIRQHLSLAKSFIQKEHFAAARKELKDAQKKEAKIKHPNSRFEIEMMLAHILFLEDRKNIDKPLQTHHDLAEQALQDLHRDANIYLDYQQLFRHGMRQKSKDVEQAWQELMEKFDKLELPDDVNIETRIYYTSVKVRIAHYRNEIAEVYRVAKELHQIFEDSPAIKESQQHSYFTALDNYLTSLIMQKRFGEVKQLLDQFDSIKPQTPYLEMKKVCAYLYSRLSLLCNDAEERCQITKTEIESLRSMFQQYRSQMPTPRSMTIRFLFATLYLFRLDYANTEILLEDFPIQKTNKNRSDLQRCALIMGLAVQVEDKDQTYSVVQASIDSVGVRLHQWGGLNEYERIALRYFPQMIGALPQKGEREKIEQAFLDEIKQFSNQQNGHARTGAQILRGWLEAKQDKTSDDD